MSPLTLDLGVEVDVVDEPTPSAAPTATDTMFLIHPTSASGSPAGVRELTGIQDARDTYPGEPTILAMTDAFFNIGGARIFVSPLVSTAVTAANLFTPQMGPGQVVAPSLVASADILPLQTWCWNNNRIGIFNGPDGASQSALQAISAALINATAARFSELEADTILIPGVAGGTSREVRASVVKAALMARSDIATGNPNLAAAGNHTPNAAGQVDYALGIKAERGATEQKALAVSQVNCFRTVNNRVRAYGDFTLADLNTLKHWWNVSGSRTMMAIRAREQAVAEELMFGQVAADGLFLDRYDGALSGVLAELQRIGAIYGSDQKQGYSVDVSAAVNPVNQVADGIVNATVIVKTSPSAGELKVTITRRALTEEV